MGELDRALRAIAVDDFGAELLQLRMRRGYVITLEERLLRDFPVRRDRDRLPPVVAHQIDRQNLEPLAHRSDELIERLRILGQVDPHESGEDDGVHFLERHVAVLELPVAKLLTLEHEMIVALQIPAPAMERTDDAAILECAAALSQRGAAMRTEVVIGLDRGFVGAHQQHRLVADVVGRVIADLRNFIEPCSGLPHPTPQLFVLETREVRIDIASGADAVRQWCSSSAASPRYRRAATSLRKV